MSAGAEIPVHELLDSRSMLYCIGESDQFSAIITSPVAGNTLLGVVLAEADFEAILVSISGNDVHVTLLCTPHWSSTGHQWRTDCPK